MTRADYGASRPPGQAAPVSGGIVERVSEGGPASRAGIMPGDAIVTADTRQLRDVIDWQWIAEDDSVDLIVRDREGAERFLPITREPYEAWGLQFSSAVFDRVRTCRNDCAFCFMAQLPAGMRPALYLRDDDYRLSFLQGNFITLTNLTDDDIARIAEQHLSPLYVSLHSADPDIRARLVCAHEDRALERFDQLVEAGIDLHVQVVLVPGINDGEGLDATLTWLAGREGVASVGIVPLGYTRHQDRFSASYGDPIAAAVVIQQVQRWQFAMRERDGVNWVHLADEFYLNARAPFPSTGYYDDFPQYENGIGLVRTFVDEAMALRSDLTSAVCSLPAEEEHATVITGVMAATTIAGALNACDAAGHARLLVVPNRFFGGNVSVTGLLVGADLASAIAEDAARLVRPTAYLLPDIVFNADGVTLDDLTLGDLREKSGADVRLVSSDAAGLLAGIKQVALEPPRPKE